ncbi:LCP family protein [Nocardioides jishulii]|uniref:LytR family transcriptional regulator n=1 Tax=Nocardioides jishulii TaxID=2575440 RepID=A0A4U2YIJ4_9ACTN|nr:LCP family protein [Nocardioides jishulii]QCX28224.1 LytR family transcriptional regulator [Nocardioides jishulii]TKI60888.1 LytR family transcriptional regulator [Nocardioides jishulii]
MASRRPDSGGPEEGSPEYRWLYGEDPASSTETQRPPDQTRVIRARPSAGTAPSRPRQAPPSGPRVPPPPPPGDRGRGPRRPRGARPKRNVFKVVRLLLLLWLVFLVAVPLIAWQQVTTVDAFKGDDRMASQPGTTYLLVGSDSREGLTKAQRRKLGTGDAGGRRTDTIMLLHTGSGRNVLTSIPRDSLVEIPGRGTNKINAAYAWGGAPLLVQTVESATGVRVDHYVEIGFGGFVDIIDSVGGVEICPKAPMKDKDAKLNIKAGCQEADGATALGYARSRKTYKALGDVDRARAQREVVSAIASKALSPWTVINPKRYYDLSMAGANSFTVSEGTGAFSMARFAWAMTRVDGDAGMTCGVPIRDLAVHWDEQRSEEFFGYLRSGDTERIPKKLCTPSGMPG